MELEQRCEPIRKGRKVSQLSPRVSMWSAQRMRLTPQLRKELSHALRELPLAPKAERGGGQVDRHLHVTQGAFANLLHVSVHHALAAEHPQPCDGSLKLQRTSFGGRATCLRITVTESSFPFSAFVPFSFLSFSAQCTHVISSFKVGFLVCVQGENVIPLCSVDGCEDVEVLAGLLQPDCPTVSGTSSASVHSNGIATVVPARFTFPA